MKFLGLILSLAVLAACDPSYAPSSEPEENSGRSGVALSGYARVGVSTTN